MIPKRRVPERNVYKNRFFEDTFLMRKGIKTCLPMIFPHSGLPYSSKRQIWCCQMDYRIIDTTSSVG